MGMRERLFDSHFLLQIGFSDEIDFPALGFANSQDI